MLHSALTHRTFRRNRLSHVLPCALLVALATPRDAGALPAQPACNGNYPGLGSFSCTNLVVSAGNGLTQNPDIVPIFWQDNPYGFLHGYEWTTPGGNALTEGNVIAYLLSLLNGPWSANLADYGGDGLIARPRMSAMAPTLTGPAASGGSPYVGFTRADVVDRINYAISNGLVPPPLAYDNVFYMVFIPGSISGDKTTPCGGSPACNFSGNYNSYPGHTNFGYTVAVSDSSSTFGLQTSHEIAEGITAYEGISTSNCTYPGGAASQIADPCECYGDADNNGWTIQSYWSIQRNGCVIPESWGELMWSYGHSVNQWVYDASSGLFPKQIYGGAGGVVATVPSSSGPDRQYYYSPSSQTWTDLGAADGYYNTAAQMAAGGSIIAELPQSDTSLAPLVYTISSPRWSSLGAYPSSFVRPATGIVVTNGGTVYVSDAGGFVWQWTGSSWFNTDNEQGHGDYMTAYGSTVLSIDHVRQGVWEYQSGYSWAYIFNPRIPAVRLITNSDSDTSWYWVAAGTSWVFDDNSVQNAITSGADFSTSSSANTWLLEQTLTYPSSSTETYAIGWYDRPNWVDGALGGTGIGRVVSGNLDYATSCGYTSGGFPCVRY